MMSKRIAVLTVAFLLAVAFSALPAEAGVGGCRFPGAPTCGSGSWESATPVTPSVPAVKELPGRPSFLDSLAWILPGDVIAVAKGLLKKNDIKGSDDGFTSVEGVGGCRVWGTCGTWQ
jgi:hypothetical protein